MFLAAEGRFILFILLILSRIHEVKSEGPEMEEQEL